MLEACNELLEAINAADEERPWPAELRARVDEHRRVCKECWPELLLFAERDDAMVELQIKHDFPQIDWEAMRAALRQKLEQAQEPAQRTSDSASHAIKTVDAGGLGEPRQEHPMREPFAGARNRALTWCPEQVDETAIQRIVDSVRWEILGQNRGATSEIRAASLMKRYGINHTTATAILYALVEKRLAEFQWGMRDRVYVNDLSRNEEVVRSSFYARFTIESRAAWSLALDLCWNLGPQEIDAGHESDIRRKSIIESLCRTIDDMKKVIGESKGFIPLDIRFHEIIVKSTPSRSMLTAWDISVNQINRIARSLNDIGRQREIYMEHVKILLAILGRIKGVGNDNPAAENRTLDELAKEHNVSKHQVLQERHREIVEHVYLSHLYRAAATWNPEAHWVTYMDNDGFGLHPEMEAVLEPETSNHQHSVGTLGILSYGTLLWRPKDVFSVTPECSLRSSSV